MRCHRYPMSWGGLLTSFAHADGGRLTLTAQKVPAGTTAATLVEQSRAALEKQGFSAIHVTVDKERARLDALLDGGKRMARQAYVVDGGIGYVVTLIAPESAAAPMTRDFEFALHSLRLGGPERTDSDGGVAR